MFTEHKIGAFAAKVGDLADVPRMAPAALKAQFDACPEELRASLNGVCDDGAALDAKVEGIVAQTFAGAIHESMLDAPLGAKLSAKAEKTALTAEETARKSANAALQTRVAAVETAAAAKCEIVCGTYIGNGAPSRIISLGFTPKALLLYTSEGLSYSGTSVYGLYGGLALPGHPVITADTSPYYPAVTICSGGFEVYYLSSPRTILSNHPSTKLHYLAFK